MYLDNTHTSRSGWRYSYKGHELLSCAKHRLAERCQEERKAREEVIRLTRDPSINPADRRVEEAKRAVVAAAVVVEELMVYVHQFAREPDKEFLLSSGDVVFFDLFQQNLKESTLKPLICSSRTSKSPLSSL
jgi:hypothetical protein